MQVPVDWVSSPCQDMKPGPRELAFWKKLGSLCQDMKPGPQGKLMYYYFYHRSNLREIIQFLREIECIKFECNEFVLVLVQIDLIPHTYGKKARISVSGHETRSTGSPNSGKTPVDRVSCSDTEIRVFPECKVPWTGFHLRVRT